jgi:hypothetical protein
VRVALPRTQAWLVVFGFTPDKHSDHIQLTYGLPGVSQRFPRFHKKELSEWKIESGLLSYYENSTL